MKKLNVRYVHGHEEPDKEGIIPDLIYRTVQIDKMYTKLYVSGMVKLSQLSGVSFPLFMYLCATCKKDGLVTTDEKEIKRFLYWCENPAGIQKTYGLGTVRKAYTQLTEVQLLIKIGKGCYRVNPVHFWKGSDDRERIDAVQKLLEEKIIKPWYTEPSMAKKEAAIRALEREYPI